MPEFDQPAEKSFNGIGRGQDEKRGIFQLRDSAIKIGKGFRRDNFQHRAKHRLGSEIPKVLTELRRLGSGPRHQNTLAEQGSIIKPAQHIAEVNYFTDIDQRRRLEFGHTNFFHNISQGPGQAFLLRGGGPANYGNRGVRVPAVRNQLFANVLEIGQAHVEHHGPD